MPDQAIARAKFHCDYTNDTIQECNIAREWLKIADL